ncbi:MAG: sigma 54-interacting transcriptional regulator [Gammaproteobacteria bacterium]|nr:sigma 54-interacting transcriptional regulator [Gammaproteobacteria bacterium]MBU1602351.1 sigma 54-interacting transcriptional regulator [Gammaproteobacteria bacterium]MBU2433157.1 sigma 54-interacting transcriptional regulator [Gammaproteobacteria bacterium]MBU2451072.1 sigma 54-interacting transcriptional regulator [Gammaproteobacteria bacterium]
MKTRYIHPIAIKEELVEHEQLLIRESISLLSRGLEPDKAIREMLHLLSELLGLNRGRVVLPDGQTGELAIRVAYGLTQRQMERGRYRMGEGITGRVMQSGEVLIVQDIDNEPAYLARAVDRSALPEGTVSFIALPIMVDRVIAGVLGVHRLRSRRRSLRADLQILHTVAELMGQIFKINQLIEKRTASLKEENRSLRSALQQKTLSKSNWGIIGEAPQLISALDQLEQVASTEATVLLLGESGTGKELFARALHLQSPRRDKPFVKVNCAAIPETLFEAELFGHEKGAFTGASQQRIGRFEQANGGTLFLDEIGDLPLPVQVKLLRVLQEHVIERLGGRGEIAVDVRIVAATHQDMMALVRAGSFRLDLYYRLNVIPIRLPALRERPGDIKLLVRHFVSQLNQRHQRNILIMPQGLSGLVSYPWPGNIRQLYNVLERIILLSRGDEIDEATVDYALITEAQGQPIEALPAAVVSRQPLPVAESSHPVVRGHQAIAVDDREQIHAALVQHGGNKSRTARALNLTLRQLNYRIEILRIAVPAKKSANL